MSDLSTPATLEYYDELAKSLPAPMPDDPERRHRRLATAIEAFEVLRPGDAYEGRLAVQIVLCGAHAVECMFEASIHREDFAKRSRCRAQATSLQREERAAKQILAREQKLRLATEAVAEPTWAPPAAASAPPPSAGIRIAPPPPPQVQATEPTSQPAPARAAAAPPRPAVTQAAAPPAEAACPPPPSPKAITQAEDFMREQVVTAAQIRHDGGVTPRTKAFFHAVALPTDPAVIDALVRGTSELLAMLDTFGGEQIAKAA